MFFAIESIINQTYHNWELIIVDDRSTKSFQHIIKMVNDNRVIVMKNELEKGAAGARNFGIKNVSKDSVFIAFLDSDDIAEKTRIEKQVDFFQNNNNIFIVGSNVLIIDENSNIIGKKTLPTSDKEIRKLITRFNPFVQSSVMLRKEIFNTLELYDTKYIKSQDYELWFRILKRFKGANINAFLVKYRIVDDFKKAHLKQTLFNSLKLQSKWLFDKDYFSVINLFYFASQLFLLFLPSKWVLVLFKKHVNL